MPTRTSDAEWHGNLKAGHGHMRFGSGAYDGAYSFSSRFENGRGTNPEELIGAAHAGCFSMALAADLEGAGYKPSAVSTVAKVHINPAAGGGFEISSIDLDSTASVPGIDNAAFQKIAEGTKQNCPVSKALRATKINLTARLG